MEAGEAEDFAVVEAASQSREDVPMSKRELLSPGVLDAIFQLLTAQDIGKIHSVVKSLLADLEQVSMAGHSFCLLTDRC